MENSLILVALSEEQITQAKAANGQRKKITHALLCGSYGQIFGTEKQCLKYYNAWKDIFQDLFSESKTLQVCDIVDYESTFDLVNILIAASGEKKQVNNCIKPTKSQKPQPTEKKGFWARIFG
ncbi:hypothetical protein [Vibrio parahaemolyticus]|uniref:hypothetical protein n=1 Tax=Vibrio parahaemolyticus TaxID=670 RepID=UPI00193D2944|nr:hypothetical protein [Vibrio parahaemolyticus]EIY8174219.1 hypothetical protein [Vibrio parahaemolyticus]EIY8252349.1 hypothetical protein [Vibrio parahaemolyticus]ELA8142479.1 hypothetical protein [Vibrio parahaemolyticus]MBM4896487.1 hypothetical protein [Vibrio parahaemolyticus]MCQ9095802.1 hypothetical protein [Vibrio parahaemolyticus]